MMMALFARQESSHMKQPPAALPEANAIGVPHLHKSLNTTTTGHVNTTI